MLQTAGVASSVLRSSNWVRKKHFMEKKKPEFIYYTVYYILTPDDKANVTVGGAAPMATTAAVMEAQ